jgi:CopG family transcriptional regulator/antitoxin EndoAI
MVPRFNPTGHRIMSKRINVILPDSTVAVLDRVTTKGNRSQFISRAVLHFVAAEGKANLRERLKAEALANAGRDVALAAEWFPLEEEAARAIGSSGTSKKVTAPKQR